MSEKDETGPSDDAPDWEPSEYAFKEPWWFEALFSPGFFGIGLPLVAVLGYVAYRLIW